MSKNISDIQNKYTGILNSFKKDIQSKKISYKKYGIIGVGILLICIFIGIGYIGYERYTYYKIPQVYKDELMVFEGEPDEIHFQDSSKLVLPDANTLSYNKGLFYNISDEYDMSGKNQPIGMYQISVDSTGGNDIKSSEEALKELKKNALKEYMQVNYDIYEDTISLRASNYDGERSIYKSQKFKELNSKVSINSYIASYVNYPRLENINLLFKGSFLANSSYSTNNFSYDTILSGLFDDMKTSIEEIYAILNVNTYSGEGEIILDIHMFDSANYKREAEIMCLELEDNFSKFQKYDDFYLRSPNCEFKNTQNTIKIHMTFKGLDIQLKNKDI